MIAWELSVQTSVGHRVEFGHLSIIECDIQSKCEGARLSIGIKSKSKSTTEKMFPIRFDFDDGGSSSVQPSQRADAGYCQTSSEPHSSLQGDHTAQYSRVNL